MIKKALLFICTSLLGVVSAQNGILKGSVSDVQTGEGLIGALIMADGTELAAESDLEGNYSLSMPEGTYDVIISYDTYKSDTLKGFVIAKGQIVQKNITLSAIVDEMGTVFFVDKVEKNNEASLIKDKQEAVGAMDVISSETFKKTSDRSTSDVLKRVTGASIQDGRFAIIRGVNDRYNTGYLNGSLLPSTESDRKAFSFEVIPANMVDNIMIMKSATPDLPGEFGGGVIRINTKAVPDKLVHSLSLSGQTNSVTTFKEFSSFKGSSSDFLGLDNGLRKMPDYGSLGSNIDPEIRTGQTLKFNNDWSIKKVSAMPNVRINYMIGSPIKIKGKDNLGFVFVLNYSDTRTLRAGELFNVEAQDGRSAFKYADTSSRRNVNTGAMLNLEYKLNDSNKVYMRNLYNISSDFNFTKRDGYAIVSEAPISYNTFAEMMRSNRLYNGQLSGTHKSLFAGTSLDWNFTYVKINRDMPDYRIASYETTYDEDGNTNPKRLAINDFFNSSTGRFFSKLDEKVYNPSLDLKRKFKLGSTVHELKLGGMYQYRERMFNSNTFVYKSRTSGLVFTGTPNDDIGTGSIAAGNLFLEERPNALGAYYAQSNLGAVYIMSDSKVSEKLRLVYGVRYENFGQIIKSNKSDTMEIANQSSANWLPSINATYMLTKKTNLRLAAFKSVNRPEFRELAEFAFFDFDINSELVGNPNLQIATINNLDARFEFFPNVGEIISVGGFFKVINNPIEFVIDRASQTIRQFQFRNEKEAKVYGMELEVRKSLDFISKRRFFAASTVFSNVSVIKSYVSLNPNATTREGRPLQGQSPYILNMGYTLDDEKSGWGLGFMFNRYGRRVFALGNPVDTDYFKDYYENPRSVIDLQVSKRFGKFVTKVTIGDLLRQDLIFYQDYNENGKFDNLGNDNFVAKNDLVMMRYKMGRTVTLGLSYDF